MHPAIAARITSTNSGIIISGNNDASFVAFGTEILTAFDISERSPGEQLARDETGKANFTVFDEDTNKPPDMVERNKVPEDQRTNFDKTRDNNRAELSGGKDARKGIGAGSNPNLNCDPKPPPVKPLPTPVRKMP